MNMILVILVLPVIVHSCDLDIHYLKDDQCCKLCPPGTRMTPNADCQQPFCADCNVGDYQDVYNNLPACKRQPNCDPNLNLVKPANPSKTELSLCQCFPDHHCSSAKCETCVKNTVCQAGQRVRKQGSRTSDTECEPCPNGTFSNTLSANTCKQWTECASGLKESVLGSSTSDRICKAETAVKVIVCSMVGVLFLVAVGVLLYCYRRGKVRSLDLEEKLQKNCGVFCQDIRKKQQLDDVALEEEPPLMPSNEPEEVTDDQFKHGVSANGMPVRQDHSKASLLSQTETAASAESC